MLLDYRTFYQSYSYNYDLYKLESLDIILSNFDSFKEGLNKIPDEYFSDKQYMRFLKSEIRVTCFHAIESLFELIFAYNPRGNELGEFSTLERLSTADWNKHYELIKEVANNQTIFEFWDREIIHERWKSPFWMYLFYFGVDTYDNDAEKLKMINESGEAIKLFMLEIATIFSNRKEYNAYKHGNRVLNMIDSLQVGTGEPIDLSDSMSYYYEVRDRKTKEVLKRSIQIDNLNTTKDKYIIEICSQLMSNVIERRKQYYLADKKPTVVNTFSYNQKEMKRVISTRPPYPFTSGSVDYKPAV